MMRQTDNDLSLSPSERMKKFNRRRWSDSPTLLRRELKPSGALRLTADHELTQSLHDLTEPTLQGVSKVTSSQNNLSTSTVQSGMGILTKSQDSGFNKSASCLSLHGSSQKYSHVESKVKKYIKDIKDAEALRKMSMSQSSVNTFASLPSAKERKPLIEPEENVEEIIDKLQSDIRDKDELIKTLQGSYEDLLLKHAEAENKIDRLRLRSLQNTPVRSHRFRQFPDSFDFRTCFDFQPFYNNSEGNLMDLKVPCFPSTSKFSSPKEVAEESCAEGSFTPSVSESIILSPSPQSDQNKSESSKSRSKEVVISAPLGPIQKLYSTSVRLDRVLQPLSHFSMKSDTSKSTPSIPEIQSTQILAEKEGQPEEKEGSDGPSEDFAGAKSNMYYTTAETGTNNLYHMTTDTGIEDCVQSATDKDTGENERKAPGRLSVGSVLKRIPNIPKEDAFSKVKRWRESLPNSITDRKIETIKPKKTRNRKAALPRKTVGVQTGDYSDDIPVMCTDDLSVCFCDPTYSSAPIPAESSDNDYAESLEITDCDNYFSEISYKTPKRKSAGSTKVNRTRKDQPVPRSRSVEPLNRHRCCGECTTCGSAIVAETLPLELSSSTSYLSPKQRSKGSSLKKLGSPADKSEKKRRDWACQRKVVRCSRVGVAGSQVTRAVLLDMLLNVQSAHSCCCCCQHTWRGRQPASPAPKIGPNQEQASANALQQCLAEIQKIAWDLNAKLAESHAGLVNLSCRKKE